MGEGEGHGVGQSEWYRYSVIVRAIVLAPVADKNRFDEVAKLSKMRLIMRALGDNDLNAILGIAGTIEVPAKPVNEWIYRENACLV